MDILAARKKAAELALQKKMDAEHAEPLVPVTPQPAAAPPVEQPLPAASQPEPDLVAEVDLPPAPASEVKQVQPVMQAAEEIETPEIEMLSFRLGEEEYVLPVEDVREVLKNRELTPIPNAPAHILGVTALRGQILSVIDLSSRLGISASARDQKSRILVVNLGDEDAGMVVDRVTGVVKIHPDAIRPVPETIERGSEFLRGIARKNEKLYILLDKEKAFGE